MTILAVVAVDRRDPLLRDRDHRPLALPAHRDRAAHRLGARRRHRLPVGRATRSRCEPNQLRARERVLPAQHRHDPERLRHRRTSRRATSRPTTDAERRRSCAKTRRRPLRSASWTRRSSARPSGSSSSSAVLPVPDPLDVDRYEIDGDVAGHGRRRSASSTWTSSAPPRSWQNTTLVYTHGYGVVAAKGNERTTDGEPGLPRARHPGDRVPLRSEDFEPRVYFGEYSPTYSIVGAPEGTDPVELDYPRGADDGRARPRRPSRATAARASATSSTGSIYALKFQSEQILFSDAVNDDSQILYDRDPSRPRAEGRAVPDARQRPVPERRRRPHRLDRRRLHAQRQLPVLDHGEPAARRSPTRTRPRQRFALDDINYIRNSVKATVDAYDGSVTLYAWDDEDPMLQTWQKVYPTTLKPISEMSGDLMSHVRYPTDLFKVQRCDARASTTSTTRSRSTQRDNAWTTPNDPQLPTRVAAAAVLPDDADARSGRAGVLACSPTLHPGIGGRQQPATC